MRVTNYRKLTLAALGLACLGLLLLSPGKAAAANPTTINFQGKIVNADGTNVPSSTPTNYSIIFRIYNTASPVMTTACNTTASCLWQETQGTVSVLNGVFQVELGSVCALTSSSCNNATGGPITFASSNSLYLTMQFNGDTSGSNGGFMSPTIHITSVPFALQADNSSTLGGLAATNFVQLAQGLQTDSSTSNASIAINKTGSTANILTLQKSSSNVLLLDNNGLLTLQPAASLTSGQTAFTQTFTNASSTGGTVNGNSQTITVSNTSSASTTNGFNISLTDSTGGSLTNTNTGISITLQGTNTSQLQYGTKITVNNGVGLSASSSSGSASPTWTCGNNSSSGSLGICGVSTTSSAIGTGVLGESNSYSTTSSTITSTSVSGAGTVGINYSNTTGSNYLTGIKGGTNALGATGSYTAVGVAGVAKAASSSATTYGGYFTLDSASSATTGAALYASNSTIAANILQLQDNNVNALVVNSSGATVLGQSNTGGLDANLIFNNASNTNTVSVLTGITSASYNIILPTAKATAANYCLVMSNTSTGATSFVACGASSTTTITLTPEYPGAVLTPANDGFTHTGTMTSDYCGNSGGSAVVEVNTSICASGQYHNYYSWTANATNYYDIFVIWTAPTDFSSLSSVTFNGWTTTSSDSAGLRLYKSATSCGLAGTVTTTATWGTASPGFGSCTISAGDKVTFDVTLKVGVNSEFARAGEISIVYNRN